MHKKTMHSKIKGMQELLQHKTLMQDASRIKFLYCNNSCMPFIFKHIVFLPIYYKVNCQTLAYVDQQYNLPTCRRSSEFEPRFQPPRQHTHECVFFFCGVRRPSPPFFTFCLFLQRLALEFCVVTIPACLLFLNALFSCPYITK